MRPDQAAQIARDVIDANQYMVLATADAAGRPWSSPVYFAHAGYREFIWVSSPDAAHSRNLAIRPAVSIVIFNSQAPIGAGQGVYMSAAAAQVDSGDLDSAIKTFSERSLAHGGAAWTVADVTGQSGLRLYRATVEQHWILAKDDGPIAASPWTSSSRQPSPLQPVADPPRHDLSGIAGPAAHTDRVHDR
jgi:nitroimidazol reductase NimA-like FMN-containing flavoprotein (pyridoxamine 5'-phosphate oxidase superfamily)